jgi:hypothetical protein
MAQYSLILHGGGPYWKTLTQEQLKHAYQLYYDWSEKLQRENRMRGGNELQPTGRVLRPTDRESQTGHTPRPKRALADTSSSKPPVTTRQSRSRRDALICCTRASWKCESASITRDPRPRRRVWHTPAHCVRPCPSIATALHA